eukprot:scaffold627276_cov46-Prasinocladus_malaysianus.AAC.1
MGARAYDAAGRDLSEQVYILPAAAVSADECLRSTCAGSEFWIRGVEPGWVNTSAAPGNSFTLTFVVVDFKGNLASVNRTITITEPCASD